MGVFIVPSRKTLEAVLLVLAALMAVTKAVYDAQGLPESTDITD